MIGFAKDMARTYEVAAGGINKYNKLFPRSGDTISVYVWKAVEDPEKSMVGMSVHDSIFAEDVTRLTEALGYKFPLPRALTPHCGWLTRAALYNNNKLLVSELPLLKRFPESEVEARTLHGLLADSKGLLVENRDHYYEARDRSRLVEMGGSVFQLYLLDGDGDRARRRRSRSYGAPDLMLVLYDPQRAARSRRAVAQAAVRKEREAKLVNPDILISFYNEIASDANSESIGSRSGWGRMTQTRQLEYLRSRLGEALHKFELLYGRHSYRRHTAYATLIKLVRLDKKNSLKRIYGIDRKLGVWVEHELRSVASRKIAAGSKEFKSTTYFSLLGDGPMERANVKRSKHVANVLAGKEEYQDA